MRKVPIGFGQSLVDMTIQEYGSIDGMVQIMIDNPATISSLDADLVPGNVLNIQNEAKDDQVKRLFDTKGYKPATWIPQANPRLVGVGYWRVGSTFTIPTNTITLIP
ncbi:hypothetical protein BH09BAC1_BH09BAC1_05030 [soil metagenome]